MSRALIISVLLLVSGGGKTTTTHEMTLDGINMSFTYEGYAVDMGEANWIYMLSGKSDGHDVAVEVKLLETGNIFGCPTQINVEVNKGWFVTHCLRAPQQFIAVCSQRSVLPITRAYLPSVCLNKQRIWKAIDHWTLS